MVCRFDKAAARRAGYSPRSARWAAHRLMRDPRVKALLAPPTPPAGRDIPDDKETGTWALARLLRFSDLRLEGHLEGRRPGSCHHSAGRRPNPNRACSCFPSP